MPTPTPFTPAQRTLAVTACVVLAHGAGLAALVATASRPPATEPAPIQVTLIDLPAPAKPAPLPARPQPAPQPATPRQTVAATKPAPARRTEPTRPSPTALSAPNTDPGPPVETSAPIRQAAAPAAPAAPASAPVVAPRFDAAYLDNPAPAYPPLSRRAREEGKVTLRVLVSAAGLAARVEIAHSSGSERLDRAAYAAVGRWRFVAARQGEQAIEAWVNVPIIFKLQES